MNCPKCSNKLSNSVGNIWIYTCSHCQSSFKLDPSGSLTENIMFKDLFGDMFGGMF